MRDETIYRELRQRDQAIAMLFQQLQIVASGDVLHQEVLKDILIDKGIITDVEFKGYIGKRLAKIQEEETKRVAEEKKKLIKPTAEETAKIENEPKEVKKVEEKK